MTNNNPLLSRSDAPYGSPRFDIIQNSDYLPAFREAVSVAKKEIDSITSNLEEPSFSNTIEALEYSGRTLDDVESVFFNLLEADSSDELESLAEQISPIVTDYELYVSLNRPLFERCRKVYELRDSLSLDTDQMRLLEDTYKDFVRGGANLGESDRKLFKEWSERISLKELKFSHNALEATKAFSILLTDEKDLEGLPEFVREMGKESASENGKSGWEFTLDRTSYDSFMKFSSVRGLRKIMYLAYNTRAIGGDFDNTGIIRDIVELRIKIANLLGYADYADYALENRMVKTRAEAEAFLGKLMVPSLPAAKREIAELTGYAKANGFSEDKLQPWDFPYWAERYRKTKFDLSEEELKPYFPLEDSMRAVFSLAENLYDLKFESRGDIPVYQKDVRVYDVKDKNGSHIALFYADFYPRKSKKGGAWMTEFRGQFCRKGIDYRPFVSMVANVSKPTAGAPALLSFYELTTILHEFGHCLHGMLSKGRYPSQCGTSVARDFVELPSQLMENWAYEPQWLDTFAKHYKTGERIPRELVEKINASRNFLSGYFQVRQLKFGYIDFAWHSLTKLPEDGTVEFEHKILDRCEVLPVIESTAVCPTFTHIFSGGYSAGYYSYKWAEVMEADAFSLFKEKGIFSKEVADSFRANILEKGSSEDESVLYKRFRGHSPEPEALLRKLGLI